MNGFDDRTVFVAIKNSTAKLVSANGKTVFWNTQKEASDFIQADGYEAEFYLDENNQHALVEHKRGMNVQ